MPKILLVEDNELNRDMLLRRLVRKGFEVDVAVDGLQGVALAVSAAPDLILMDMSLPGIDGWEATRQIRANPCTRTVPVIALTAHAMSDDRTKALAAGCDDFDTKPVDLERLLGKMQALLTPVEQPAAAASPPVQPVPGHRDITLPALPPSLLLLQAALDEVCNEAGMSRGQRDDLQVVLDEVCANIFKHAYPADAPGTVRMELRMVPHAQGTPPAHPVPAALELRFIDQGLPFNPLAQPEPITTLPLEERPLGGLGIHLVRQLTDRQHYSHTRAEGNRLTLWKHLD